MGVSQILASTLDGSSESAVYSQPRWYAAYTNANHEKSVAAQFSVRAVEHFLPQYESLRRWKDRQKKLQLPLFPGYVFVKLALRDRLQVIQVPGVVRLVGFGEQPVPLADAEVEGLREALAGGLCAEPHRFLKTGQRVRIVSGPLAGREGILKRWKGDMRVLLSIELIQRSILIDVDASALVPLRDNRFDVSAPGVSRRAETTDFRAYAAGD